MVNLIPRDHWEHRFSDVLRGFASACGPQRHQSSLELPGLGPCLPVRSGRVGVVTALRSLNLPPGARVGVPLFCCPIVFSAIAAAECVPVFLDVEPGTFCLSAAEVAARSLELQAVLAVHMFGNLCDMPAIQQAVGSKPLLEDCAQALGSRLGDRPAGSFGSFGIFSFRSAKYLSVGEGGALFSRQPELLARASTVAGSGGGPGFIQEARHVGIGYLKALLRSKPLYGLVGYSLWNARNCGKEPGSADQVRLGQPFRSDLTLAARRMGWLHSMVERQREIAKRYAETLDVDLPVICAEKPGTYYNRYLYPLTLPTLVDRDQLAGFLHKRGIDTMRYLDQVVEVAARRFGYSGGCPVAEQLSKRVLTIPCHYGLSERDIEHISHEVNTGWARLIRRNAGECGGALADPVLTGFRI